MERVFDSTIEARRWNLSWVAYLGPLARYGIILAILSGVSFVPWRLTALVAVRFLYRLLDLSFTFVAIDEQGVWLHRGVTPPKLINAAHPFSQHNAI